MMTHRLRCCCLKSRYHRLTRFHLFRFRRYRRPTIRRLISWANHRLLTHWHFWLGQWRWVFGTVVTWCNCFRQWRRWWLRRQGGLRRPRASLKPGLLWGYLKRGRRQRQRRGFATFRLRSFTWSVRGLFWQVWWWARCHHIFLFFGRGLCRPWRYLSEDYLKSYSKVGLEKVLKVGDSAPLFKFLYGDAVTDIVWLE